MDSIEWNVVLGGQMLFYRCQFGKQRKLAAFKPSKLSWSKSTLQVHESPEKIIEFPIWRTHQVTLACWASRITSSDYSNLIESDKLGLSFTSKALSLGN